MAAKISAQVQDLVEKAAELPVDDLAVLAEAIRSLRRRGEAEASTRHDVIAERVARVQAGGEATLSMEEVAQSVRDELDF